MGENEVNFKMKEHWCLVIIGKDDDQDAPSTKFVLQKHSLGIEKYQMYICFTPCSLSLSL